MEPELHSIPTLTHGRMLQRPARSTRARGVLVGFHGYMENAAIQLQRLADIPGAASWTLVSIQGLHRFYRGRSEDVVASWMTREDRDAAIADNLAYVAAALEAVPHDAASPVVHVGFSQGAAMAFRAALRGPHRGAAVVAVGADVPPELLQDSSLEWPRVLLARGDRDEWYTQPKMDADVTALRARNVHVTPVVYPAAHEWSAAAGTAIGEFLG